MALDHLARVNETIADIAEHLAAGREYVRAVGIRNVKPSPATGIEVVGRFPAVCDSYLARLAALGQLKTAVRHIHPWFGPLDAHSWHILAALHQTIHRRQVGRIVRTFQGSDGKFKFSPEVS